MGLLERLVPTSELELPGDLRGEHAHEVAVEVALGGVALRLLHAGMPSSEIERQPGEVGERSGRSDRPCPRGRSRERPAVPPRPSRSPPGGRRGGSAPARGGRTARATTAGAPTSRPIARPCSSQGIDFAFSDARKKCAPRRARVRASCGLGFVPSSSSTAASTNSVPCELSPIVKYDSSRPMRASTTSRSLPRFRRSSIWRVHALIAPSCWSAMAHSSARRPSSLIRASRSRRSAWGIARPYWNAASRCDPRLAAESPAATANSRIAGPSPAIAACSASRASGRGDIGIARNRSSTCQCRAPSRPGVTPESTDWRTSSCLKTYAGASKRSIPALTHSSTESADTSGMACTSEGSMREPMTAADSSASRARGERRETRASTASCTVAGRC